MIFSCNTYLHVIEHVAGGVEGQGVRAHFNDAHVAGGAIQEWRSEVNRSRNTRRTERAVCVWTIFLTKVGSEIFYVFFCEWRVRRWSLGTLRARRTHAVTEPRGLKSAPPEHNFGQWKGRDVINTITRPRASRRDLLLHFLSYSHSLTYTSVCFTH